MEKKKKLKVQSSNIFKKVFDEKIFISKNAKETQDLGMAFSRLLKSRDLVFLKGNLGSGKTTFMQGIVWGFGNKSFARSSSFVLVNEYCARDRKLYHLDLYRLEESEVWDIGIEEYIYGENIAVVEWAEKIPAAKNDNSWEIIFKNTCNNDERIIKIEKKNENFGGRNFR